MKQEAMPRVHPADARRFLRAAAGGRFEGVFVLALTVGLRPGELLGLKWRDLDSEAATLRVERAIQRCEGKLRLVDPKTVHSRRLLPLPGLAAAAVESQRAQQERDRGQAGDAWREHGLIFTTAHGLLVDPDDLGARLAELRAAAGLPNLQLHDLRQVYARFLLDRGVEPRAVMELLGYASPRLVMGVDDQELPKRMTAAASIIDELLGEDDPHVPHDRLLERG